jgi:chorismate synthase
MVEAMVALTLVDHLMLQKAQCELLPNDTPMELQPNPMGTTAKREGGPSPPEMVAVGDSAPISQRVDEE